MTNSEYIRRELSDEELAQMLMYYWSGCPDERPMKYCEKVSPSCVDCWVDWLGKETDKKQTEENNNGTD